MNPILSVVMPTFNGEKYVGAALESVREQASDEIEVIVVDDGSTDSTLNIVRRYADRMRMRLFTPTRSANWVAGSNLGLREARGEWVCFLHQDDVWLPGRMARIRPEMDKQEHELILHNAMFIGPDGEPLGRWTCPLRTGTVSPNELLECLLVQNFIAMPAPLFRRAAAVQLGGMDERLWFSADWDFWLRLCASRPSLFTDEALTGFRVHPGSQTAARKIEPGEWRRQLETVFDRHFAEWNVGARCRTKVERAAAFSITVNCALSAASRGDSWKFAPLLYGLARLGPSGLYRYFTRSRILERVGARARLKWSTGARRSGNVQRPYTSLTSGDSVVSME